MITLTKRALFASIGAALAATALVVALALTLGGTDTFSMRGTFSLLGGGTTSYAEVGECVGYNGYDDIQPGTQVTVFSTSGEVLAIGKLGPGKEGEYACTFPVTVKGVPEGHKMYQVEVSHRGKVAFAAEELQAGKVALSLG